MSEKRTDGDVVEVYGDRFSGNCYKVSLLLDLAGKAYRWHDIDILKGESRTPEFLALNPNGRVPAVKLADGRTMAESNAILYLLAVDTPWWPATDYERADVLRWQAFEQYSHEPYIATSRYIIRYLGNPPERRPEVAQKRAGGWAALDVMEQHLAAHDFFVGDAYTIADISLYAYTHVADEGGFPLDDYPAIRAWISRIAAHPGHVPMG